MSYREDIEQIRESEKVNDDDLDILTKYIAIASLSGNEPEGKTYDEILEKIKTIQRANSDNEEKEKMELDIRRERMTPFLSVHLQDKAFSADGNKNVLKYTVTLQNLSPRKIKMVVGDISITDLLDKEIKKINIVFDEDLRSNAVQTKTYTFDYDHGNENDQRIRSKDLTDLRAVWNPVKIIFEDGRSVE